MHRDHGREIEAWTAYAPVLPVARQRVSIASTRPRVEKVREVCVAEEHSSWHLGERRPPRLDRRDGSRKPVARPRRESPPEEGEELRRRLRDLLGHRRLR